MLLSIGPSGTNLSEIWIKYKKNSLNNFFWLQNVSHFVQASMCKHRKQQSSMLLLFFGSKLMDTPHKGTAMPAMPCQVVCTKCWLNAKQSSRLALKTLHILCQWNTSRNSIDNGSPWGIYTISSVLLKANWFCTNVRYALSKHLSKMPTI